METINSSRRIPTAILLHNNNKYGSILVGYSVIIKEFYENLLVLLDRINYKDHNWVMCDDLKIAFAGPDIRKP